MLQTISGKRLYVVDLTTMPELPITGIGWEIPYAKALTAAIRNGKVTVPGKYGIEIFRHGKRWSIYKIL